MFDERPDPQAHKQHISEQLALMDFPPAKHDAQGRLLPLRSYAETIERAMDFALHGIDGWFKGDPRTLIDENGVRRPVYFYYSNLAIDGQLFRGAADNHVSYPAFHHANFIESFTAYHRWKGDREALQAAIDLADWNISHSTPLDWRLGGMPYSTFNKGKAGGFVDGAAIMPDKAAIMATAYLRVFAATGVEKYRAAALGIAEKLAAHQLPAGNWHFRVNPQTGEASEAYTSSAIYAVILFDTLNEIMGTQRFRAPRDAALNWILENPVKSGRWGGFYEDIPEQDDNKTNRDCLDTAAYLIQHRRDNPAYMDMAISLHDYVAKTPIRDGETFVNRDHPYAPAEALREQKACFVAMSGHTARWALFLADLYHATGDEEYRWRAVQAMNIVTYCQQSDGRILIGVDYRREHQTWAFNQFWFSNQIGILRLIMKFRESLPELAEVAN